MDIQPLHQASAMNESLSRGLEERQFRIQRARDCLEKTQELFERFGSAELKSAHARFEELKRGLESDRVQLAVLGEFSRGKSELLNALLGIELLWVANDATTAVNTFLHALSPGRDERFILIHYQDGRPAEEIAWSDDEALKPRSLETATARRSPA
jgi:predicted GTPase